VPADVDGGAGDRGGQQRVAAGPVDPGGLLAGTGPVGLPARGGGAHLPGAVGAAGGDDDEVLAVGGEVHPAHVGVERVEVAGGGVPRGRPGRQLRGALAQVDHRDLVPGLAVDPGERPVDHHAFVGGVDGQAVDLERAGA